MEQPSGIVEGSLTLYRPDGFGGGEWWQTSRHRLGTRTKFWERCFIGPATALQMIAERQTDDLWGQDSADEWIFMQAHSRVRSGFSTSQLEGQPGPQRLTELLTKQATPGTKRQSDG